MRKRETCATCRERNESWEVRCARCAVSTALPADWPILIVGPSLWFRLIEALKLAAASTVIGFLVFTGALALAAFLPQILSGTPLAIIQFIVAIVGLFSAVICISLVYVAFTGIRSNAAFSITKTKIKFNDIIQLSDPLLDDVSSEPKFIEAELALADVRRIHVRQGWLARQLGYGNIEVFTDQGSKPKAVITGVTKPKIFKQKLELLLEHLDTPVSELTPMPPAELPKKDSRVETIVPGKDSEPDVRQLKISLWLATPIALCVFHILLFIVGFVIGVVVNPMLGVLLTFALSSWPYGMFAIWGIYHYFPRSRWPVRVLIAIGVCLLNGLILGLTILGLIGRPDFAIIFAFLNRIIVFVGGVFYVPVPSDPFFFELFEKSKGR